MRQMGGAGGGAAHAPHEDHHHATAYERAEAERAHFCDMSFRANLEGFVKLLRSNLILACLLVFVPIGIVCGIQDWGAELTFLFNFIAIIPLAWLIGQSTEDLAAHTGQIVGGLLNASFGNVIEALLCFWGLYHNQVLVVQCTLVGSILSNLLLVMGTAFFAGGYYFKLQEYSALGAVTNTSLLTLSCLCLVLPTMYAYILSSEVDAELAISRGVSILLAALYAQYLYFQLSTHSFMFAEDDQAADNNKAILPPQLQQQQRPQQDGVVVPNGQQQNGDVVEEADDAGEGEEEEDEVMMPCPGATMLLAVATVITAVCSEFLIDSIQGVVDQCNLSREFIGIILLPIIGNAAEHYTAISVAMRNKMDLSLGVAVGSSCQMALFVTPLAVLMGWCLNVPMTLNFHPFQVTMLLLSTLVVTGVLQDGHSNWLEGSMLLTAYVAIALIYWFEEPYNQL